MSSNKQITLIESAYENPDSLKKKAAVQAVEQTIKLLDQGKIRVCVQKGRGQWETQAWVKKAILLYFRIKKMKPMRAGDFQYLDKIPTKKWSPTSGVRVVPHALARYGSFVQKGAILMPSYVNIGAYVGEGTMIDTWATVGSCAQVGAGVHISGGVGIGGVLEPIQASPVIVEDHAFVGSRCIIVEGAVIEEGAVIGAGVTITASTKIIDVTSAQPVIHQGRVPAYSVVIPGTTSKNFPAGAYGVPCALIIGKRSEKTDQKTSLTSVLRDYNVSV